MEEKGQVTVTIKYYDDKHWSNWATVSIARSIRFLAEAGLADSYVLKAIAIYYSMFHFVCFLFFLCEVKGDGSPQAKVDEAIKGRRDPRNHLRHPFIEKFAEAMVGEGLSPLFLTTLRKAREIREFVNYGPDLLRETAGLRVDNRKFEIEECIELESALVELFEQTIKWFSAFDKESMAATRIYNAFVYFVPNEDNNGKPFYRDWSTEPTLLKAEQLLRRLYQVARPQALNPAPLA